MILPTRFLEKGSKYDVNITADALVKFYGAKSRADLVDHFKPYYDPTNHQVRVDFQRNGGDKIMPPIRFQEGEAKVLHPAYISWADSEPGTWSERYDPLSDTTRPTEETPGVPEEDDEFEIEDEATAEKTEAFNREVLAEMEANASMLIDVGPTEYENGYKKKRGKGIPKTISKIEKFVDISK